MLANFENKEFIPSKTIEFGGSFQLHTFDIDWFKERLNVLETFDEGEFIFAQKLRFQRKYITDT